MTTGDRAIDSERGYAQDLTRGNGKVMRITTSGAPAPGNPGFMTAGAQAGIWSYGHRNKRQATPEGITEVASSIELDAFFCDQVAIDCRVIFDAQGQRRRGVVFGFPSQQKKFLPHLT